MSLQCDLIVDGGTLVARSGVNVAGNGHAIEFRDGGRADFQGTPVFPWSGDGSNPNLGQDITFDDMSRIMFHHGAGVSTLKDFKVQNSGTSSLGFYPLHFHLNGNTTRGTLVERVVVVNGRNHAFVPHGSHGITFKDTVALNTVGDPYWWDDPGTNQSCSHQRFCTLDNSNDITYDHALASGVTNGVGDNRGFRLTGFKLGAGSGNVVTDSVARDINPSHVVDCAGYSWPESANQNIGGNVWGFTDNRSFDNACHGIFVWQNDSNAHIIDGFVSNRGIDHGAYLNQYDYRNVDVDYVEIHALGWSMEDSTAGDVIAKRHTLSGGPVIFDNVVMDSFTVDNRSNGGNRPGEYRLTGSGLDCSDIVYRSVVSGTKVIVDGTSC